VQAYITIVLVSRAGHGSDYQWQKSCAAYAPIYLFILLNKDPRPGISLMDRAREMDYVRSVLTIGAFVSGVMAVSFGGVTYDWNSGQTIGLFCCSSVFFILLGL
jgi:hypothetical protein